MRFAIVGLCMGLMFPHYAGSEERDGCIRPLADSKNDWVERIAKCDTVIERDPGRTMAYFYRGVGNYKLSNYHLAIPDLRTFIEARPAHIIAYSYIVQSYRRIRDETNAQFFLSRKVEAQIRIFCRGSSEEKIAALQDKLTTSGYYKSAVDGLCGPQTRAALKTCALKGDCRLRNTATPPKRLKRLDGEVPPGMVPLTRIEE